MQQAQCNATGQCNATRCSYTSNFDKGSWRNCMDSRVYRALGDQYESGGLIWVGVRLLLALLCVTEIKLEVRVFWGVLLLIIILSLGPNRHPNGYIYAWWFVDSLLTSTWSLPLGCFLALLFCLWGQVFNFNLASLLTWSDISASEVFSSTDVHGDF